MVREQPQGDRCFSWYNDRDQEEEEEGGRRKEATLESRKQTQSLESLDTRRSTCVVYLYCAGELRYHR